MKQFILIVFGIPFLSTCGCSSRAQETTQSTQGQTAPEAGEEVPASRAEKATGIDRVTAELSVNKTVFSATDGDSVKLALRVHNHATRMRTLPGGGGACDWISVKLVCNRNTREFSPWWVEWDRESYRFRCRLPPRSLVLAPGETKSFEEVYPASNLLPGTYRIVGSYRTVETGVVEIEVRPRGDVWDRVATANNATLVALLEGTDVRLCGIVEGLLSQQREAVLPAVLDGLKNRNPAMVRRCFGLMYLVWDRGKLKAQSHSVVEALAVALERAEPATRVKIASYLCLFGEDAKPAVPALVRELSRTVEYATVDSGYRLACDSRPSAAYALALSGDTRPEIIAGVLPLLDDPFILSPQGDLLTLTKAVGIVGPRSPGTVPKMLDLLAKDDYTRRLCLLEGFELMKGAAKPAIPAIYQILADEHEDPGVRAHAAIALVAIRDVPPETIQVMVRLRERLKSYVGPDTSLGDTLDNCIETARKRAKAKGH